MFYNNGSIQFNQVFMKCKNLSMIVTYVQNKLISLCWQSFCHTFEGVHTVKL